MPSKKPETIWQAEPHTLAKVAILRGYLTAYFQILGRAASASKDEILYIDGFAGPGEYTNAEDGSPTIAAKAARAAIAQAGAAWRAGDIRCVFVEAKRWIHDHLVGRLATLPAEPRVHTDVRLGKFDEVLARIAAEFPRHLAGGAPLFAFIDPFGATGAPFRAVKQILASPRSEVLINFDVDGIGRIFKAGKAAASDATLTEVFGDTKWLGEFSEGADLLQHSREALDMFKRRLRALPNVRYVFSFEMQKTRGRADYHLVFASQHKLGLVKMKEAMKQIARDGTYEFCDATVGQAHLFRYDEPALWAHRMYECFKGQTVGPEAVEDFMLNETPFYSSAGKMMDVLDDEGLIEVAPVRRRGSFVIKKVKSVHFRSGPSPANLLGTTPPQPGLFDAKEEQN